MSGLTSGEEYAVEWLCRSLRRLVDVCEYGANGWFGHSSCRNGRGEREALADADSALLYAENVLKLEAVA